MTDLEKLRSIRAGLVVLRRRSADSVVGKIGATWYPADNLSKIQAEIDAVDRAITDEENLARVGAHA